ncbi:MAG TPA: pyridoxamine 5'-phosphate oxidase family protein [Gammaproteobacteria bacterium]|nr:pyridoxamine 5'-phosphate oxidase family protein [Gammaproteobacteria bacterium]
MGQRYSEVSDKLKQFIEQQKIFFVATATADSRVNISPKGMDSLRILDENRLIWLNVTGSGNETAAHVQESPRMTLMFAAFEGSPMILRLYGTARAIHKNDSEWDALYTLFKPTPGARQIFDLSIDLVQTSCGMAVPLFDFAEDRTLLKDWADKKGEKGVQEYWQQNNQISLDGKETGIIEKNTQK